MFKKQQKQKSYSPEKIADLYLRVLAADREIFLNGFLSEENIYHDIDTLNRVREILEKAGYVEKLEPGGFSVFTYNPPGTAFQEISGKTVFVPQLAITDQGRRFVGAGQEIDVDGKASRIAERKKWVERLVTSGIALIVSVLTMTLKWYFFDKK